MKNKYILIISGIIALICTLSSCTKDKYNNTYKKLLPIVYKAKSDTINVKRGTKLVYKGLSVQSKTKVSYEWSYGPAKPGTDIRSHQFLTITKISDSPTIDYSFFDIGSFILRLKMDNGESIELHYFTLNVNAGFDDGVMLLNNDDEGKSHLSFVANLSSEEKAAGAEEFYYDIFPNILPDDNLTKATDMYLAVHKDPRGEDHSYASFLVSTNDEDGNIYSFDPYSLALISKSSCKKEIGSYCKEFGGFFSVKGAGASYVSAAGDACRYDLTMNFSAKVYSWGDKFDRAVTIVAKAGNDPNKRYPFYTNEHEVCCRWSQSKHSAFIPSGEKIINLASARNKADYVYILTQNEENPNHYSVWYGRSTMRTDPKLLYSFDTPTLMMDKNSRIISTQKSADVYYNYKNAIYRWSLSSKPSELPAIKLADNEIITDISSNYNPGSADSESVLYVSTYNPKSTAAHKGSFYIFDISNNALLKSYPNKIDKTVRIIYKYRFN